ncbi:caspase short class (AGAP012544-PA) [Anopheles sinensis]|uniref:Caspase short class (AGAP012544-PA) n=1 Tax=Anopheles sinensis TaxID=74873 RepID=A0A084WIF5_ANOSI|nr:caspase short class (AGAP012544-PA) [Anopheles sinensis]
MSYPVRTEVCYNTSHPSRGRALLINYEHDRPGSVKDTKDVYHVLEKLQFAVTVATNLKERELMDLLEKESKEDHTNSDCFVMVVMAHGTAPDMIKIMDGYFAMDRLWKDFVGNLCSSLKGKPKLFFIQSCRGNLEEKIQRKDAVPIIEKEENFLVSMHADLLVMYASYYKHAAYRDPTEGAWFIQALCNVLSGDIRQTDLLSLLTDVSYDVMYKYANRFAENGIYNLQIPMITSMLTKKFYFVEKYVPAVKGSKDTRYNVLAGK